MTCLIFLNILGNAALREHFYSMKAGAKEAGTEEKIKKAARRVFLEKGFEGTKMRDIAEVAGINSALTNYYFRSKENLFRIVFEELLKESLHQTKTMLNSGESLRDKITQLIEHQYQFHDQNPKLALFIMNEIRREPERFAKNTGLVDLLNGSLFYQQVEAGITQKVLRPISPSQLLSMMYATSQQLFAGKSLHMFLFQLDDAGFKAYAEEQVRLTTEMILNYLFWEV